MPEDAAELIVLRSGPLATVQDRGRVGYAELGVPRSGALDLPALLLANRLTGNPESAAALELTLGQAAFQATAGVQLALTGAPVPVTVDGVPAAFGAPCYLSVGAQLRIGAPIIGVRSYLAVAGGFAVPPVLGSRSYDTLSGIGPPPLRRGDRLPIGPAYGVVAPVDHVPGVHPGAEIRLRVRFGPRDDWFADPAELLRSEYALGELNRIGARLAGPALARARSGELASEGLIAGAVQVPGDGQPVIFLADHPTTGGYPVIAAVHPADLVWLAQARPGTRVCFRGP